MLLELHVKNLALIEQADVEFTEGLNILTGETGAGKSIIIGSVNLALGQKATKEIIRGGAEYAYVELVFFVEEEKRERLRLYDVTPDDDGMVIISRKIMATRSSSKINDETVTAGKLKQITGLLMDIHGQHEHQSLLYHSKHLEILDIYAKSQTVPLKQQTAECYKAFQVLCAALSETSGDEESRKREADFLRFEVEEIENAALKEGEEEALAERFRFFSNGRKIIGGLSAAFEAVDADGIGRALRQVNDVSAFDERIGKIRDQLYDAEAILSDIHHEISDYLDNVTFDEEELTQIESRLDLIRNLQAKYGNSVHQIHHSLEEKKCRLEQLEHFDEYQRETEEKLKKTTQELEVLCETLSQIRQSAAEKLTVQISDGLEDLNFLDVQFSMEFRRLEHFTAHGYDEGEFVISTNPGEPMRSLGMVASGGELSRIMLAIKTVLADSDEIPTLIFDEIDTGISGRTAQRVSEKLSILGRNHQVICITHLPQIAAMADRHFEIAKFTDGGKTSTKIQVLSREKTVEELARLLGGAQITDAVRQNANEMIELANASKLHIKMESKK